MDLPTNHEPLADIEEKINVLPVPDSQLALALGGIGQGMSILVSGPGGVGKSTAVAHLCVRVAKLQRGRVFWCNADQSKALVRECFARTNTPVESVYLVPRNENPLAIMKDTKANDVIVIDSLQPWIKTKDPAVFLADMHEYQRTTFIIARTNMYGITAGKRDIEFEVDAVVYVTPEAFTVPEKCRWTQTPRQVDRI